MELDKWFRIIKSDSKRTEEFRSDTKELRKKASDDYTKRMSQPLV